MKKIFIILSLILSVVSFSEEIANQAESEAPTIENISVTNLSNEQFIQNVIGSIESDSEITSKMDKIGEEVDTEVGKQNPDWKKVEQLYNELSIYTNKLAVNMMRVLKEQGVEKTNPEIEEEINSEIMSDMNLDEDMPTSSLEEKEIMDAIKKEIPDRELERMEYLSSKIAQEIEKTNPDWEQVEKDYNELSMYTNKVTVVIMKVEKNKNKVEE